MTGEGFNLWGASKVARTLGLTENFISDEPHPLGLPWIWIYRHTSTLPPDPLVGPYQKVQFALGPGYRLRFPYGVPVIPDH